MKKTILLFMSVFITYLAFAQTTLNEGFESWPPTEWEIYLEGESTRGWRQDFENISHTGNHSADSNIANNQMDNWLVSSAITVVNANYELKYWEISDDQDIAFYDKSSVQISTGSPDPADGDYVEIYEANTLNTVDWEQRTIDLSAFEGETIYVAFRHEGTFHQWFVDDVTVGPTSFSDAALVQVNNPVGVSESTGTQTVLVVMQNLGTTVIDDFTITWGINGSAQPTYNGSALNLQPGESTTIDLGNFDFATEGFYDIEAQVNLSGDFDTSNDQINSTYEVSSFKDGGIVSISPDGMIANPTTLDVLVSVQNFGVNTIDIAEINWSVNGIDQTPFTTNNLNLASGQAVTVNLGQYAFTSGLNDVVITLNALGDIDSSNDQYEQTIPVDVFWESFEGASFPPEGWSINFGVRDDINFDTPVEGNYYYASQPAENFFGVVTDTLYTPLLDIENGDRFRFYIKTSPAQSAVHTLVWKNGTTGEVNYIADIDNSQGFNTWEQRDVDISAAAGINYIGIVSTSNNSGLSKFDLFTSDAKLYQYSNDLKVVNGDMNFIARQNVSESFPCRIKNLGQNNVLGSDYTIKLMEAPNTELTSVSGVNINSLQEAIINIDYSFTSISNKRLYFEIEYASDQNLSNNTFREATVSIVPNTVEINTIGELEEYFFVPFSPGGSTQTLGEDDLTEAMFYNTEFNSPGYAYGVAYKYDNILPADKVTQYPLKVWVKQTSDTNLSGGFSQTEELVLVYDGVAEILPGFNKDLYIPFNEPILLNGIENVVVRVYQYDPEWPPSILRFIGDVETRGETRTIGALDVFNLDPDNPPTGFFETTNYNQTRFVVDPVTSSATVSGTVYDLATNNPIPGATIVFEGSSITAQTDINGNYTLPALPFGLYNIIAGADGYLDNIETIDFNSATQTQDFFLSQLPEIVVSGFVYGDNAPSTPLESVTVTLSKDEAVVETISSNSDGSFTFPLVFGGSDYEIKLFMYGYDEMIIPFAAVDTDINFGNIILSEEFISPFDVQVDENSGPTVSWKSPKLSSKVKLQYDLNEESNGYANEPNEDVWLGNYYLISELTTITSVEIQTSIYQGVEDFVTIDIIDLNSNEVIASSEPFLILQNATQVIDVPNIVVDEPFMAAVHWQNNAETTNFLSVDFSDANIFNGAVIRYPGELPGLLSDLIGVPSSFLLRVNTLDDGTPITNNEAVTYNVYRGLASEFPDTSNWTQLNSSPISELDLVDADGTNIDPNVLYRYAVETVYANGESEVTFSNEIMGSLLSTTDFSFVESDIQIYPVPAENDITIKIASNIQLDKPIEVYDSLGKRVFNISYSDFKNGEVTKRVSTLQSGIYFVKIYADNSVLTKKIIVK
ncbi:T9SS-dependent choice-of-anchor J family protein [Hanstruepera flava]|uniref:T9SS-dependent choice-of-anchor J family protein n=1 Tax=Hanstruepera flava TaxID=2930218 RepID=UPI0020276FA3|nr:choice-of-anchor J domain-containing protein [Hanstruepera flava]